MVWWVQIPPFRNIYINTYAPKSSGSDVNDISFNPNTVRFFNCEKPGGRRSIGFELKSAVCKLRRCLISSGMSGISVTKIWKIHKINKQLFKYWMNELNWIEWNYGLEFSSNFIYKDLRLRILSSRKSTIHRIVSQASTFWGRVFFLWMIFVNLKFAIRAREWELYLCKKCLCGRNVW